MNRIVLVTILSAAATASAQTAPTQPTSTPSPAPAPAPAPTSPTDPTTAPATPAPTPAGSPATPLGTEASAQPDADKKPKQPKRGDFDAGGQVRLPNGPDENNKFASFNWVALDLKGRYFLLDQITVNGNIPLAVDGRQLNGGIGVELLPAKSVAEPIRQPKPAQSLKPEIGFVPPNPDPPVTDPVPSRKILSEPPPEAA